MLEYSGEIYIFTDFESQEWLAKNLRKFKPGC
jgi:hypothetical protein